MGQIPSHWETRRFRFLLAENSLQNTDLKERKQLQFKYGDIVPKANQSGDKDVLDTIKKYTVVAPGDIMINGLNLNYDFISQRVAQVQEPGVITSAYVSLRPLEGANSKYYTYYMKAMDAQKMFHGMGSGVRLTLSYDNLKNLFFPYPSPEEQEAIVAYLDAATAKIDDAIAQQQRMIDLLNERKRIIVFNSITKGVKSNAMKEIGIEDIGVSHREVRSLKTVMSIQRGFDLTAEQFINGPYPVYGSGGLMGYHKMKTSSAPSIIIGRSGSVGKLQFITDDFWAHNTTIYLSDTKGNNVRYLYYLLSAIDLQSLATQTAVPTLDRKNVLSYKFPIVLDIKEQNLIASYLDAVINAIDTEIEHRNCSINLLQERKQIIINDVVTGKVRV